MFIKAIIKDREGKKVEVLSRVPCDSVGPTYSLNFGERMKGAMASNALLLDFTRKAFKYANEDHAIEILYSDNFDILKKFGSEGIHTEYQPDIEGSDLE